LTALSLIAVVDDDGSLRLALGRLLRSAGLEVRMYAGGPELLADPQLDRIACVVSDIRMPGFSGFELFEALRARGLQMPMILMTALVKDGDEQRARLWGSTCFLQKPFAEADLMRCIDKALGRPSGHP
jgi:FixJ family two-component response regulator